MRRRILLLVIGAMTLVVLAFAIPLVVLVRNAVYQSATRTLPDTANRIALFLRSGDSDPTSEAIAEYLATLTGPGQPGVRLPGGTTVGWAPPADATGLPPVAAAPGAPSPGGSPPAGSSEGAAPEGGPGGSTSGPAGLPRDGGPPRAEVNAWGGGQLAQLAVAAKTGGLYEVRVFASDSELVGASTGWTLAICLGGLGLLVAGAIAAELLTRRLVRPLTETADTARRLGSGDVTARAPTTGPREIAEVGTALNALADRIDELITEERETAADLSHRLRTPLTALRLDAEALTDPADADRIGGHVARLERALTAVIHGARRPQREGRMPGCDAAAVIRERVEFWTPLAEDQLRRITAQLADGPVPVRASAEDLAVAVDALLENVIAHTPEGTDFAVLLASTATGAELTVADDGPGLAADELARGRSGTGSSGLGLDIARRCAESSGGSIRLSSNGSRGAAITLELGRP